MPASVRISKAQLGLVLGTFCLCVLGVGLILNRRTSPDVELSDGSVWRLHKVTFGTNHHRWIGSAWHSPLAVLPQDLAERIAGKPLYASATTRDPAILLWGEFLEAKSARLVFSIHSSNVYSRGSEFHPKQGHVRIALDAWPRHADEFDLTWLTPGEPHEVVGRVKIKNPLQQPPKVSSGLLHVSDAPAISLKGHARIDSRPGGLAHIRLAIFENNEASTNYGINALWMEDMVGNQTRLAPQPGADHTFTIFSRPLWAPELGWAVHVELARLRGFSTNELVIFTNVILPSFEAPSVQARAPIKGGVLVLQTESGQQRDLRGSPGILLRFEGATNRAVPVVLSVHNPGRLKIYGPEMTEQGTNFTFYARSFEQDRANITCAVGTVHTLSMRVIPTVD